MNIDRTILLIEELSSIQSFGKLQRSGDSRWSIDCVDGKLPITLFLNSNGTITLHSSMAGPDPANIVSTFELMLRSNAESNGLRFALSEISRGTLSLETDIFVYGLDIATIKTHLQTFVSHAGLWQIAMQNGGFTSDADETDLIPGEPVEDMLRV